MVQDSRIASRYAKAFFTVWAKRLTGAELKKVISSVEELSKGILAHPQLKIFWLSSGFHLDEKQELIKILALQKCQEEAVDLLNFLITRKRTEILEDIVTSLKDIYNKHTKTLVVTIASAFELSPSDKKEMQCIVKGLEMAKGHVCEFLFKVEPYLLGGILLTIGRYVYEYSVKSAFNQLRRKIEVMDVRELGVQPHMTPL